MFQVLLLHTQLFSQDPEYQVKVKELVEIKTALHHAQMLAGIEKPNIPKERALLIRQKYEERRQEVGALLVPVMREGLDTRN